MSDAKQLINDYGVLLGSYLAMEQALAKRLLTEANAQLRADGREDEWPAQQKWSDLAQTSHELFYQRARAEAGLPREASFKNDVLMPARPDGAAVRGLVAELQDQADRLAGWAENEHGRGRLSDTQRRFVLNRCESIDAELQELVAALASDAGAEPPKEQPSHPHCDGVEDCSMCDAEAGSRRSVGIGHRPEKC